MRPTQPPFTNTATDGNENLVKAETWIIVPAKPLSQAKSRLATVLTPQTRQNLAFHLLEHTLQVLDVLQKRLTYIKVLLISSDLFLLKLSEKYHIHTLFDDDFASENDNSVRLNKALTQAAHFCATLVATKSLLILPADLPFLQLEDLLHIINKAKELPQAKQILISPDRFNIGSNALFIQPADLPEFAFRFGRSSFAAHLQEAKKIGVTAIPILNRPGLLFDLDSPADFYSLPNHLQQQLLAPIEF